MLTYFIARCVDGRSHQITSRCMFSIWKSDAFSSFLEDWKLSSSYEAFQNFKEKSSKELSC